MSIRPEPADHLRSDPHVPLARAAQRLERPWDPLIVTQAHGMDVRLVRVEGEFVWHAHPEAEEIFILVSGEFGIDFRDRRVVLSPGDVVTVPRRVEHKPYSPSSALVYVIEPQEVVNTGDRPGERTRSALKRYA